MPSISEQNVLIVVLILSALGVAFVLLGIQLKGEARDKLVVYMLEHSPDTVTRLSSNERVLRWTYLSKSLTVTYRENVLTDITYKYRDLSQDLVLTGKLTTTRDFDDMHVRVLCD